MLTTKMTRQDVRDIHANCGLDPIPALHHVAFCIEQADVDADARRELMDEYSRLENEVIAE